MTTLSTSSAGAIHAVIDDSTNGKINEVDRLGSSSSSFAVAGHRRGFDPIQHRSHLYHAIEGMHRYPNYLQRWQSESEMDALEDALRQQLDRVRSQRQALRQEREQIAQVVAAASTATTTTSFARPPTSWDDVAAILDGAFGRHILPQCHHHDLADVLHGRVDLHYTVSSLTKIMTEETTAAPEVFGLPILDRAFCQSLQDHIATVMERSCADSTSIVNLDWVELGWLNDLIFHAVIRPIARHLYDGMELDWRHGYLARYDGPMSVSGQHQPGGRRRRSRLVKHSDDSAVTLNIGINDDYDGGMVRFGEFRGELRTSTTADEDDNDNGDDNDYQHERGKGILHSGRHFHSVTPVTRGERWVWILWTRSWSGDRSVTCPCCWLNNRDGNSSGKTNIRNQCICGPAWN